MLTSWHHPSPNLLNTNTALVPVLPCWTASYTANWDNELTVATVSSSEWLLWWHAICFETDFDMSPPGYIAEMLKTYQPWLGPYWLFQNQDSQLRAMALLTSGPLYFGTTKLGRDGSQNQWLILNHFFKLTFIDLLFCGVILFWLNFHPSIFHTLTALELCFNSSLVIYVFFALFVSGIILLIIYLHWFFSSLSLCLCFLPILSILSLKL